MTDGRRARVLAALASGTDGQVTAVGLLQVCRDVTSMTGAGVMLMLGDTARGSVGPTDEVSAIVNDLQYALGEGPGVDAHALSRPVLEPDLAEPSSPRWLAFTGPALRAGVRGIFAFPLCVGAIRLGALNLYSDRPGWLTDDQHVDALVAADIAAEAVLAMQARATADVLAAELEQGSDFQYTVHQAAGMVAVQLDISVAEALVRLRAHAFAQQRPLGHVAADVVARRLSFRGWRD